MNHSSPAPWEIGPDHTTSQDEILDADGRTIAVVWTRTAPPRASARAEFKDCPKGKANLRLMTAAPKMLDALKPFAELEIAHYSASGMQAFTSSGMHKIPDEWQALIQAINKARTAIAEATA